MHSGNIKLTWNSLLNCWKKFFLYILYRKCAFYLDKVRMKYYCTVYFMCTIVRRLCECAWTSETFQESSCVKDVAIKLVPDINYRFFKR